MKNIKGPLSLNRQLESHKYDIDAPLTNSEAGTEHWNKTNTANLHISCVIKKKEKKRKISLEDWSEGHFKVACCYKWCVINQ